MWLTAIWFLLLFPRILWQSSKDGALRKSEGNGVHLYGIQSYYGLPGQGKTYAMSRELRQLRKRYGDKIYICTNYFYDDQDFPFTGWQQLLQPYDRPLVVAWDEVQNEFNSRDFKNFPIQLLTMLTQVRKGNGVRILTTSQRYHFVDKNFRSLADTVVDCHTIMGCFGVCHYYDPMDYDELTNTSQVQQKMRIRPKKTLCYVQNDDIRGCYDSFAMLQSAKSKDYQSREEVNKTLAL